MELVGKIKLKVALIMVIVDKTKLPSDERYLKILLENENIPCQLISDGQDIEEIITEISNKYLKYDSSFINKSLAGLRYLGLDTYEAIYISTIAYVPGLNKGGTIYSFEELNERNIKIDEYYEQSIAKFGRL